MSDQVNLDSTARAEETERDGIREVVPDLGYQRLGIVNVAFSGPAGAEPGRWVLIDAGITGSARVIRKAAEQRFGSSPPAAIVMTHGHFDHVGALRELAETWDVPVYAHEIELRYLDGSTAYPPPDPTVGGGMMAALSRLYPRGPVDVAEWLRPLPADHSVPGMPGWEWIHTPGHTEGHVSLWRPADHALVAGDAFITTDQESAYAVAVQKEEIHGPPMYFTPDWAAARESVRTLAALDPELVVSGHGRALAGEAMRAGLRRLAADFEHIAVPEQGRYVGTIRE